MKLFLVNVIFALVWMMVSGSFSLPNFFLGFLVGAAALALSSDRSATGFYIRRVRRILGLAILFLVELLKSAIRVAAMVLRPDMGLKPGIFSYVTELERDFEITLLANLITLTPGTLSVDVGDDGRTLYIHAVDCGDIEGTRRDIRDGFERKIREAFE